MKRFLGLLGLLGVCFFFCSVQAQNEAASLNLIPYPQKIKMLPGRYMFQGTLDDVPVRWVDELPGVLLNPEEAYRLSIHVDGILIEAITSKGAYWAKQTLKQLVAQGGSQAGAIPCCEIVDFPAFSIRGLMHDVGRSYISMEELKRQIAMFAQFKINVFHWHLTEDLAWRLESKVYPELTNPNHAERDAGKYYTIEEAQELVQFCKEHQVLLIPEIDMPGHSAAFKKSIGYDMQSPEGMKVLKRLMDEICEKVFPDLPYMHIGTDEVDFSNPMFVPEMVSYIRSKGKKVISWNPGWQYQEGAIDMTQLWSYRGKAQKGIPAIDSRFHYLNHFDMFGDIVALYNSRIYNQEHGSSDVAGGILAVWNDRKLEDERQIVTQNYLYPNMLAFAERIWLGGGSEYFDKKGVVLPVDTLDKNFIAFQDFERRMLWHKKHTFKGFSFPYIKQTNVRWRITDPFPNGGDLTAVFPPEKEVKNQYVYQGKGYLTHPAIGAGIYLRHVWGKLVSAFYADPQENHTAYAYTWVYAPKPQKVGLWLEFQNYSRSEADLPPKQGTWDYKASRVWINDVEIRPPLWSNEYQTKSSEIPLKNENCVARPPIPVSLHKGWNKVFLKLPVGKFSLPEIRLVKWAFTCVFVTLDGEEAVEGLIYNPEKK